MEWTSSWRDSLHDGVHEALAGRPLRRQLQRDLPYDDVPPVLALVEAAVIQLVHALLALEDVIRELRLLFQTVVCAPLRDPISLGVHAQHLPRRMLHCLSALGTLCSQDFYVVLILFCIFIDCSRNIIEF